MAHDIFLSSTGNFTASFTQQMHEFHHSKNNKLGGRLFAHVLAPIGIFSASLLDMVKSAFSAFVAACAGPAISPYNSSFPHTAISQRFEFSSTFLYLIETVDNVANAIFLPFVCLLNPDKAHQWVMQRQQGQKYLHQATNSAKEKEALEQQLKIANQKIQEQKNLLELPQGDDPRLKQLQEEATNLFLRIEQLQQENEALKQNPTPGVAQTKTLPEFEEVVIQSQLTEQKLREQVQALVDLKDSSPEGVQKLNQSLEDLDQAEKKTKASQDLLQQQMAKENQATTFLPPIIDPPILTTPIIPVIVIDPSSPTGNEPSVTMTSDGKVVVDTTPIENLTSSTLFQQLGSMSQEIKENLDSGKSPVKGRFITSVSVLDEIPSSNQPILIPKHQKALDEAKTLAPIKLSDLNRFITAVYEPFYDLKLETDANLQKQRDAGVEIIDEDSMLVCCETETNLLTESVINFATEAKLLPDEKELTYGDLKKIVNYFGHFKGEIDKILVEKKLNGSAQGNASVIEHEAFIKQSNYDKKLQEFTQGQQKLLDRLKWCGTHQIKDLLPANPLDLVWVKISLKFDEVNQKIDFKNRFKNFDDFQVQHATLVQAITNMKMRIEKDKFTQDVIKYDYDVTMCQSVNRILDGLKNIIVPKSCSRKLIASIRPT